ncbi:MAG: tetratricopeptide repeat protein, partial [Myxococcales bacterium]
APPAEDAQASPTLYDGEIASVDRQIGRFIEKLKEKKVLDDTILVFTSDHGESLGEHAEATHALFIYESTIHVPLILRYPHGLPAGKVYGGAVGGVDVMPTILGLAGLKPNDTQGADLSKALAGTEEAPLRSPYSESVHPELEFGMAPLHGLRSNQWTYIRAPRAELYDRSTDPGEVHNLLEDAAAASDNSRAQALALEKALTDVFEDSKRFGIASDVRPIDDETTKMLQALGYMDASGAPAGVEGMDPKDGVQLFNAMDEARQFALQSEYQAAKDVLLRLLDAAPSNASARNLLALCELHLGNMDAVEKLYLESLAHEPRQAQVLTQLGRLRMAEGKLDAARARLHEALAVDPAFIQAMIFMAYIEIKEGKLEAATAWYDRAIESDPKDPAPYQQYGDFYFRQNEFEKARGWYEKTLELQPQSYLGAVQAGMSALRLNDMATAERYFLLAGRNDPNAWQPLYNLACVQSKKAAPDAAFGYLQRAIAIGFVDSALLRADPCFAALHADPRFVAIAGQ